MSHQNATLISSLNLLTYPVSSTYFAMKQHYAHYASLKSVDTRREQHSELIDVCLSFLRATSGEAEQSALDTLLKQSRRATPSKPIVDVIRELERREPVGCKLLELSPPLTPDALQARYRSAAVRYHPDLGGDTKAMSAINQAYIVAQELLMESQFLESDGTGADFLRQSQSMHCVDYRSMVHHLLFTVYLDDWSLDDSVQSLRHLLASLDAVPVHTKKLFDVVALAPDVSKLAARLSLTTLTSDMEWAFRLLQKGVHQAKAQGLFYEGYLEAAEAAVIDGSKPRFQLNHLRQLDNARRLGVVNEDQYSKIRSRLDRKRSEKESNTTAQNQAIVAYSSDPGFLKLLPTDKCARGKSSKLPLVPEPAYFANRIQDLSDDQQAEYLRAFGTPAEPQLFRKYFYVRLQSLFESAIMCDLETDYRTLESEALFLAQNSGTTPNTYATGVAECILFIANLRSEDRGQRLALLRTYYGNGGGERIHEAGSISFSILMTRSLRLSSECFDVVHLPIKELRHIVTAGGN